MVMMNWSRTGPFLVSQPFACAWIATSSCSQDQICRYRRGFSTCSNLSSRCIAHLKSKSWCYSISTRVGNVPNMSPSLGRAIDQVKRSTPKSANHAYGLWRGSVSTYPRSVEDPQLCDLTKPVKTTKSDWHEAEIHKNFYRQV